MGQQTGMLGLRGTVGGLVFAKDGTVRQKPASNKAAFASKASMARVRENAAEFGAAAKLTGVLRPHLLAALRGVSSKQLSGRLTKVLRAALALDTVAVRGSRRVLGGNLQGLVGFEINESVDLRTVCPFPPSTLVDVHSNGSNDNGPLWYASGTCALYPPGATFDTPASQPTVAAWPDGATHYMPTFGVVSLWGGGAFVHTKRQSGHTVGFGIPGGPYYPVGTTLPIGIMYATSEDVEVPVGVTDQFDFALCYYAIDFYQEVNGEMYLMRGSAAAIMSIAS